MSAQCTILMVVFNGEATIARALDSALLQGCPVLVVNDGSTDQTQAILETYAPRVQAIHLPENKGIGNARKVAVESATTPYGLWLDADDEFVPGRVANAVKCLEAGAQLYADGAELYSGAKGAYLRQTPMPGFMLRDGASCRLFERNYLPGSAWLGIDIAFAKKIGYSEELRRVEDYDFLLRALAAGGQLCCSDFIGYKQYDYPCSLSRNIDAQLVGCADVLRGHSYGAVYSLYKAAGYSEIMCAWGQLLMATYRKDWGRALECLKGIGGGDDILETDGPFPYAECWRKAFHEGTLRLILGEDAAGLKALEDALVYREAPELWNNTGVALRRLGREAEAADAFQKALGLRKDYFDGLSNLEGLGERITAVPLRAQASRSAYTQAGLVQSA